MRIKEYIEFLRSEKKTDIDDRIAIIEDMIAFLIGLGIADIETAGKKPIMAYAKKLIGEGRNSLGNLTYLCEYFDWLGFHKPQVAFLEIVDCYNAMKILADEIEKHHGREVRDFIFSEPAPPLGADEGERCAYTRMIMERMAERLSLQDIRRAWFRVQHGLSEDFWRPGDEADREKYPQCGGIDAFLALKRRERDAYLKHLHNDDKLWHTIEISDEVLDYVTGDLAMEVGRREGDRIYINKVPYNPIAYSKAADPKMKRYYACHCPLVREAILQDKPISPDICYCSLGHASHYLAGIGRELKGEVLESVVKGDMRCRFVFYLPDDVG